MAVILLGKEKKYKRNLKEKRGGVGRRGVKKEEKKIGERLKN